MAGESKSVIGRGRNCDTHFFPICYSRASRSSKLTIECMV